MTLVRPRLTDYYDIPVAQSECDFAIPLLDEDMPLYVDPFLLWKSPSLQDSSLHTSLVLLVDKLIKSYRDDPKGPAATILSSLTECDEAGLGLSGSRHGHRLSVEAAAEAIAALNSIPQIRQLGIRHLEVLQLLVPGVAKDRISDITCSALKSFLIDFTIEQCKKHGVPTQRVVVSEVLDHRSLTLTSETVDLPVAPDTGKPVLLIPKRWLRYAPWINFDNYFDGAFTQDGQLPADKAKVLSFNRQNYGMVERYLSQREAAAAECTNDPVFRPISIMSAKRRISSLLKLPTGNVANADKEYERLAASLLASALHPQLDFADEQVRTDSGVLIRDVIFYNTRTWDFLQDIHALYGSRQLVFELKNVAQLEREHINQINRYLSDEFGRFGVLITRNRPPRAIERNLVDLWSGQRKCVLVLTDEDLELMVSLFESKQRIPIEVLKRTYSTFTRRLPS